MKTRLIPVLLVLAAPLAFWTAPAWAEDGLGPITLPKLNLGKSPDDIGAPPEDGASQKAPKPVTRAEESTVDQEMDEADKAFNMAPDTAVPPAGTPLD
ncbi:hypothetical protein [Chachezhania sediminis]|uniref:hypothetical protein n=1 Tax=Chachezhania sediminis TaxID=2599291 RepID=UPI00131DDC57|nr:hypothetical protein [Chachezhania sediminis]